MENLYVVESKLYTSEKIDEYGYSDDDIEYSYLEPVMKSLDNGVYLILDNDSINCEIVREVEDGVYESILVKDLQDLKFVINTINQP